MKVSVGTKIGGGFALSLAFLSIIGAVSFQSVAKLIETAALVAHTDEVRFEITSLLSQLQDIETGARGYVLTGEESYLEPYQGALGHLQDRLLAIRKLTADNPNQQRRLDSLEPLIAQKLEEMKHIIELRRTKGFEAARQEILTGRGKRAMDDIRKTSSEMDREESDLLKQRVVEAKAAAHNAQSVILGGALVAFVSLTVVGFLINGNIARPLREMSRLAEQVASGNLNVKLTVGKRTDEVGVLQQTFGRMVESLRQLTGEIRQVLVSAGGEILAATTQVASGAAETATAVSQTTSTVEQVKQTAQLSNQKARYVSEIAQKSAQVSQAGRKSAEETIQGMNRIREQMESVAESILRLSEQSQAIGEIIATVNDLAEQSNLLAVNAAIEAARAGDQGRGFAVVAQEVKSLAEQSKQATAQVRAILGDIQKATSAAVMATEQGTKSVEAGVKQSLAAGESVEKLAESIAEATQAATQIAASSQQQLVGMDQVALAMQNIKQASSQNVAGTKQVEAAAQNLHQLGQKLKQLVEQYTV